MQYADGEKKIGTKIVLRGDRIRRHFFAGGGMHPLSPANFVKLLY